MVLLTVIIVIFIMPVGYMYSIWGTTVKILNDSLIELVSGGTKVILGVVLTSLTVVLIMFNVYGLKLEVISMFYTCMIVVSVAFWVVVIVDDMIWSSGFVRHFLPSGVNFFIGMVLSVLELFSHFIRPLTLCIRLRTNITAGHVMLGMMSMFAYRRLLMCLVIMVVVLLVIMLEVVVALLQSFIFRSLLLLYHSEFV